MKKVVFLTIAALFMFGCTKTSEYYVEKAETLTDVKSGCRSLTEINEIALKAAMNFMADGTKSNKVVKIASIIPYNDALTKSSDDPQCYVVDYENSGFSIIGAKKNMPEVLDADQPLEQGAAQAKLEHQEFGYCTEFILRLPPEDKLGGKKTFIESRFKAILNAHGNSIVEVRDEDLVKVHIHTMVPGNIISFAQQYGEFVKLKIENMSEQHSELIEENTKEEPKPEVKEKKKYGLISVCAGKGIEEIFKSQRVDYLVSGGQTMNPATEDFVKAIKEVNAENVFIFPNNSNIIMAATQAKDVVEGVNVIVIPTKTIPQGIVASMMFNPIVEAEENEAEMNEALANVKTGQVTYSIKDTSVDGVEVKKDEFMSIVEKKIISCNPSKVEAAKKVVEGMVDAFSSIITVLVGEDVTKEEKEELSEALNASYAEDGIEIEVKDGLQPVYSFIISVE